MKSKTIIGMIATAALCVVLSQISTNLKENNKKDFQEALEKYKNSSNKTNDSIAQKQLMDDVLEVKKKQEERELPTKGEIDSVNAQLPVLVSEGTLFTKVEYDDNTKVQTFHYRFTQEIDESMLTKDVIKKLKTNVVSGIKNSPNSVRRINAGVTFLYIYSSIENKKLYEIKIDSKDIK
jgi:predicted Zn-dependent protease